MVGFCTRGSGVLLATWFPVDEGEPIGGGEVVVESEVEKESVRSLVLGVELCVEGEEMTGSGTAVVNSAACEVVVVVGASVEISKVVVANIGCVVEPSDVLSTPVNDCWVVVCSWVDATGVVLVDVVGGEVVIESAVDEESVGALVLAPDVELCVEEEEMTGSGTAVVSTGACEVVVVLVGASVEISVVATSVAIGCVVELGDVLDEAVVGALVETTRVGCVVE